MPELSELQGHAPDLTETLLQCLAPIGQDFFGGAAGLVSGELCAEQHAGYGGYLARANGVVERLVKTQETFVRLYFNSGSGNGTVIIHVNHQTCFGFQMGSGRLLEVKSKN